MKEVAAVLHISPRTAESHKYDIMQALGVQTTAELIQCAIRMKLVARMSGRREGAAGGGAKTQGRILIASLTLGSLATAARRVILHPAACRPGRSRDPGADGGLR